MTTGQPSRSIGWGRREKIALGGVGLAVAAYVAYKAYCPTKTESKEDSNSSQLTFFGKWSSTVSNYAQTISATSGACAALANDVQRFLTSDSNETPKSLRQLAKLLQSDEVQACLRTSVETVARGAADAVSSSSAGTSALETAIEAVLSERGRSLLGLAVGIASKNATASFCDFLERMQASQPQHTAQSHLEAAVQLMTSENGDKLLSLLITRSIRTFVSSYVDSTAGYNMYEDMLSSISKQEHRDAVSDIMTRVTAAFCKEMANAVRKATPINSRPAVHDSTGASIAWDEPSRSGSMEDATASCLVAHQSDAPPTRSFPQHVKGRAPVSLALKQNALRPPSSAWVKQVADLAKEKDVRSLVVEVAGSATREATRGMIETFTSSCRLNASVLSRPGFPSSALPIYALFTVLIALMMYAMSPLATPGM